MQFQSALVGVLCALHLLNQTLASATQRPIYAVAHRVLRNEAVTAALSHGANALEVDLTAWYFDWWADHDGKLFTESRGFTVIRDCLNANEAVVLSGETNTVLHLYSSTGNGIPVKQMVMDFGDSWLGKGVDIYPQLRYGSWKRDQGKLGKVFSWTSAEGDTEMVRYLLGEAGIDGLIYGYQTEEYNDKSGPKSALKDIVDFVETHSDTHRMATEDDTPW
ncbi:phospholipase D precursor [Aspergillus bombycis]|uniref:Phospholipase D n=1 Tax=Aspergillus bombycis TaxID=109264 RepID=A0A1F8ACD9_9EURO|nr:phospholipase D precursor [Aspergillus bombycis]OGM49327.1 phospholipase D precursor [Aspergillus bombycis]